MLTYIEPCGWCSSSIASSYCPSNVNKYPNLSSSLISNSDSLSISTTDSTSSSSSSSSRPTSTSLIRSSYGHPNDYYTSKRIDELHERMDDIQISSFLKFINHHLSLNKSNENLNINDLVKDLSNGHILIDLIEILSSTKLKREHGRTRFHSLMNVQYVLDYLKLRMQHINISPHEIVEGNRKQILALLWIIMKIFNFPDFRLKNKNCFVENTLLGCGQDRSIILKWLNHILNHGLNYSQISIQDFSLQTWNNGYYLSLILKYLIPISSKYLTLNCFDYLKELNSSTNRQFQICLNLSNYCFNTITIIDYNDQSDKCLFRYFTELQQNVLSMLKTNQVGKLMQNNPYTKQILETIEHSSNVINDNEQYLVCIEDDKQTTLNSIDHFSRIRTVEKSRVFNEEQQKMIMKRKNRWEKIDNISSNPNIIDDHQHRTNEPQQFNGIEQNTNDQVEPELSIETEQINEKNIENQLDQISERSDSEEDEESTDEYDILEPVKEIEQLIATIEEQKQILLSNEKIEPLEQTELTIIDNKVSVDINGTDEVSPQAIIGTTEEKDMFTIEHKIFEKQLENQSSIISNEENEQNGISSTSNGELEQTKIELKEIQQSTELDQPSIPTKKVEQFIENNSSESSPSNIVSDQKPKESIITIIQNDLIAANGKSEQSPVASSMTTGKKLEKPAIIESQHPIVSNGHNKKSTGTNKKAPGTVKNSLPMASSSFQETRYAAASSEPPIRSTMVVKEPEQRKIVLERPVQIATAPAAITTTTRNNKYSEIVSNQTSKSNNESLQGAAPSKKHEQSTVSKKKAVTNEKLTPAAVTAEEIEQVPLTNRNKESEQQPKVSLEKTDQSTIVVQEPPISAISNEDTKKSTNKNKKSRRSKGKKGKANNSSIKTETSSQQPIMNMIEEEEVEPSTSLPQEEKPQNIQSEIQNSLPKHENPPVNSGVVRSRKSKKKKTVATTTTTLISKSSLTPISTAPHRNLFVIIQESLYNRKIVAFKCVVILICLCFSIIVLVLSHK